MSPLLKKFTILVARRISPNALHPFCDWSLVIGHWSLSIGKHASRLIPIGLLTLTLILPTLHAQELFEGSTETVPPEVERMYAKGLQYLAQTQSPQGAWSDPQGSQPAVVGLAVLSMLAHGEDPNNGPYSAAIRRGLDFILNQQQKDTGYIGSSMYNHGFATLALAEAYGMVNDPRIGPALKQAVKLILDSQSQNPFNAWRYSPQSRDADTTVSGAQLVALFAARNAGIGVPQEAIKKALTFFLQCQSGDGGMGYTSPGGSNLPRTAIAALVWTLAKQKDSAPCKAALQFLTQGTFTETHYYHYYLYYVSQVYFHKSQEAWEQWNRVNIGMLRTAQKSDGSWDGSQGVTFSTATSLLSLALNYRFLPIYER